MKTCIYFDSNRIPLLWLCLMSKTFAQKHSCLESWELNDVCSRMTLIFLMSSPDIPSVSPSVQPTQRCTTVHITLWSAPSQLSTHAASSPIKAYVQFCQFLLTDFKKETLISRRSHFYETHLHWLFINSGGRARKLLTTSTQIQLLHDLSPWCSVHKENAL